MKFRGGHNILLQGRPGDTVRVMPEPEILYLPLRSRRFEFSDVRVKPGQHVEPGDILAKDPDNYGVPLLAPRGGIVQLDSVQGHIVLENIDKPHPRVKATEEHIPHIVQEIGASGIKRYRLLNLGVWEFFSDAYTGLLPDPIGTTQAVIVSTLSLEPFLARGDVQLQNRLLKFTRGLEHLQSLLEYQPIYLVVPDIKSALATRVRENIRGYAWVKLIEIPLKYPYDNFNILARSLGLKKDAGPIWSLRTEGILAVDRALTLSRPSLVRIVSIAGPEVESPVHLKVMSGYPLKTILEEYVSGSSRVINGGMLTGETIESCVLGLEAECRGLTVIPEHSEREFLSFVRPGLDRSSYSGCFLSSLRKPFAERYTTGMRGEGRPCICCHYCDEVCPADIMPHLIHKYLYADLIEEADEARVDLCVQCGLCSFVCPSKIELVKEFIKAKELIELDKEEVRKAEAARQAMIESKAGSVQESKQ